MECPTEGAAADPTARSYSQVLFTDIPRSYPLSANVTCCYTLTSAFQPNTRDWVGVFKVGWSSTKDYHTFVWVEPCLDVVKQGTTKQAVFKEYYLPKDDTEFYQFCYIDSTGQVRGASTPFCFKNPTEQSLESSPDDDLLVITTQEQVEQSAREKVGLMKALDQKREETETLKSALQAEQQEVQHLKALNEQKEQQMNSTLTEMDQLKEENKRLKSASMEKLKEDDRVKEQMIQMMTTMELQQQNVPEKMTASFNLGETATQNERYDQAVRKINQLKEEREGLRTKNDAQSAEIDQLKSKLKEEKRELLKVKDDFELLQVDLQSSNKEKMRLCSEMQKLQILLQKIEEENRALCSSLSQKEVLQKSPDDDAKVKYEVLLCQLGKAQEQLAEEKEGSRTLRRLNEDMQQTLDDTMTQLKNMASMGETATRTCDKHKLQLAEAHAAIAEKDSALQEMETVVTLLNQEKQELINVNQTLQNENEDLSRAYTEGHHRQPEHTYEEVHPTGSTHEQQQQQQQNAPEQPTAEPEHLYSNVGITAEAEEEDCLVCRHCQERFPGITKSELDQHEACHRICPFCTMICDSMEQSVFEDHVYSHEL